MFYGALSFFFLSNKKKIGFNTFALKYEHDLTDSKLRGLVKKKKKKKKQWLSPQVIKNDDKMHWKNKSSTFVLHIQGPPPRPPESFSLTHDHYFKHGMRLHPSTGMKTHECGRGASAGADRRERIYRSGDSAKGS